MVIVMIRCKQLASCLAKEEEAQVQQVTQYCPCYYMAMAIVKWCW